MKPWVAISAAIIALELGGCAIQQQLPVSLDGQVNGPKSGRIGVAMTALPKFDIDLPGANCLLCIAVASGANSALSQRAQALSYEDLPKLKYKVADLLRRKGAVPVVIEETISVDTLDDYRIKGPNIAKKDFSRLAGKYRVDRVLVIDITALGFQRTYSAYIPTSDPKGYFRGLGYMVNLKNNTYEWYMPVTILKSADGNWDEPPKFPGLTNAYYNALELGKDRFTEVFAR